jgi:hypothetical protein
MKDTTVSLRLNKEDLAFIKQKAKTVNMNTSKYILTSALQKDIIVIPEIKEFRTELRRIGNNLNQIAILCNSGIIKCAELGGVQKGLADIWQSLNLLRKSPRHKKE